MITDPTRILFVDDEPSIRITLPAILEQHGFALTVAATVSEALQCIQTHPYDVLIADLNIGEPSDGFTVVSAMRRTQPDCVNLILTGYPAFESALQAIRSHVDDYLVKPADVKKLVELVREKLSQPRAMHSLQARPLSGFLGDHLDQIVERTLEGMKAHAVLSSLPIPDRGRIDHIPRIIEEIIQQLESGDPDRPTGHALDAGYLHGEVRREQGYSIEMLVDDTRILNGVIYSILQDNLLIVDVSTLVPDLKRMSDGLDAHLQESLKALAKPEAA